MKKITVLIALMITSLGFAQPSTSAPVPSKLAANVVSIYGEGYTNIGTDYNPNWGQTGTVNVAFNPGDGNLCMAYTNFNYQGTNLTATNASAMEYLHIDVWTATATNLKVSPINNGTGASEFLVDVPLVQSGWSSVDIPKSAFTGMTWDSVYQIKFDGQAGTNPSAIYLDNIYFWKTPVAAGTPTIGALTVPAKNTGDAPFTLTNPTSDSSGAFSYTSSNTAVATISGNTVTIVGAGSSTITANQAASTPFVAGSVTATLVVSAVPTVAAPTPPARNAADVISLFSNAYSNITIDNWNAAPIWYAPTGKSVADVQIAGNDTKKVDFPGFIGVDFSTMANRVDLTSMERFHMDIWTETATLDKSFNLKLSNFNGGASEANAIEFSTTNASNPALPNPNPGTWISLDMPLSAWTAGARNDIAQFIVTSDLGTVYFDNVYIYKGTALSTAKFETSNVKMYPNPVKNTLNIEANTSINKVSVYTLLGQEVLSSSPKTNAAAISTSSLAKGVYVVKTEIDGNISTSKFVKE
jgi:hypothetical protein